MNFNFTLRIILEFLELLLIGIWYYIYNFVLSLSDIKIFFHKPLDYLKLLLLKFLVFYEYFFLPPRWVVKLEIKKFKILNPENYTYGETPYVTIYNILKDLKEITSIENSIFIDLGSGTGKTTFTASILFNLKSIGVDNIRTFINKSNNIKKILSLFFLLDLRFLKMDIEEFLENKIEELKEKPLIFYITSTAFEENFFRRIIEKIIDKTSEAYIITVSKPIPRELKQKFLNTRKSLVKLFSKKYYFSWGKSTAYLYALSSQK